MKSIAIIYGSTTDNTKAAAEKIAEKLSDYSPVLLNVADASESDFDKNVLILGTSTWGLGELQDDWVSFSDKISNLNLASKEIALFGMGDSEGYADTFVDGMAELYDLLQDKGANFIGAVPTAGYTFDESKAVVDGSFVGLPLDDDNESDKTDERINAWVENLKKHF